ncbi:hypothetical protein EDC01DRAFT_749957 [Geopyxis carbonaria]|nr:hypothetical protein EDC01DRAFT_749957 [Geopyxis carbonaria]
MSERDSTSESGGGHHNIVLTPEEKKVFGQLFQAADCENLGVVTGELAVKFFEKSGLSPRVLGEIWGIADTDNRGLLTKVGFSVALRLIGQAQSGQHPRPELAQQPGPIPRFEGVHIAYPPPPPPPVTSSPPLPALSNQQTGPAGMIRVPPLTPPDLEKFSALFEKSGASDGILQGGLAREIFQRSKLPTPTLIQIWNLADRQQRGALGQAEFVVAMHLITCSKNGSLPVLPQILPPGLYEAAAGRPPTRDGPGRRGPPGRGMPTMPPVPPIPRQFSGPAAQRAQSPLSRQFTPPAPQNAVQRDTTGWAINAADKQRFDAVFLTVDKANPTVITGEEAVPFFSNSKLSEEVLAQIWDLADVNKAGQLNRDEFAIAMHLIVQQRSNPGVPLPDTLPLNLIPPSMRQQRQLTGASAVQPPSPFDPAPPPPQKSAAEDLFGLDSFSSAQPQAGPAPTPSAGPFDNDVWSSKDASPAMSPTAHSPVPPQGAAIFGRPAPAFVPTSSFGQSIMPTSTGGSNQSGPAGRPSFAPHQPKNDMDDLLGDADPEVNKKLTNETTELANLSNQIGTLTKQTQELRTKRASAEHDLSSLSVQKQNIEAQLNALRTAYEKEAAQVKRVEDQLAASRADTTRATTEYQKIEVEYNQLQYKKQEVSSQLEADRRENENLKERMNHLNVENRNLREELEKLQIQARREKGLVAINKKQAAQSESERDKLRNNIEDAQTSRSNVTSPVPPGSPTLSQSSHTNPFYRKSPPVPETTPFAPSPFAPVKPSMDDVFGPAFGASATPTFSNKAPTEVSASGPSASEGGHGEHSTPPTSPPASSYDSPQPSEAPPPSMGMQLTSAFLPLAVTRADSTTSSVQVNPSVSVRGEEFSRPDTPTNWIGSATAETPGRESVLKADTRRESFSVKSDAGTEASVKMFPQFDKRGEESKSPYAQLEKNITGTTSGGDENRPKLDKTDSFRDFSNVPGAFPSSADQPLPIIKPTATGESNMSNRSRTSNMSKSAFGVDPFNLGKDETRSTSSRQDFDDAFKNFGLGRVSENNTGGSGSVNANKFDKEFPPIEEIHNDSDSDSDRGGFDDNFVSSSPNQTHAKPVDATTPTNNDQVPDSQIEPPPAANAQQAPPTYGQATTMQEKAGFPAEYSNLLPSRTDPMKHDAPTPGGSTNAVSSSKPAKDEFDDAFGDLADAEEADEKTTDNEFSTPSAFDDFDPVFDNPPNRGAAPGTAVGGEDDFAKFSFNIDEPQPAPQAESPVMQAKTATSDDWDRIFADFGGAKENAPAQAQGANGNAGGEPGMASSGQSGTDPGEGGGVSLTSSSDVPASSSATGPIPTTVTEGGVNVGDDEKVQQLTAMGFDRESSMKALEKNGWNLDRRDQSADWDRCCLLACEKCLGGEHTPY